VSWADLDRLAVAKPRADGAVTLVARDERSHARILEARPLSIIVAIARVTRGRRAIAERYGGRGAVVYATAGVALDFVVDAVSAAGGVVFDGVRESAARSPMATTVQLDAAFCDLASAVRRRVGARTFTDAIDLCERELHRALPDRADPAAWWTAILELVALVGEAVRERQAARWITVPAQRLPFALDLGADEQLLPGALAQTIVEGGAGSMRALLDAIAQQRTAGTMMPLLCDRRSIPLAQLIWEQLVAEAADTDELPVVVYVEDLGETIRWPSPPAPPAHRALALANLAAEAVELTPLAIPGGNKLVLVTGGFYAAESLLVPATMAAVRAELGGPALMFIGVPARGHLMAIDGWRATIDDDLRRAFLALVEQRYLEATERDRISSHVISYEGRPLGLVSPAAS
jgi:hypothetical protein